MLARAGFTTVGDEYSRRMRMNQRGLDKWLHQNHAILGDCLGGCLLDNYFVYCKRGWAIIREHPTSEWSSVYMVTFYPTKFYSEDLAWDLWYEFVSDSEN